MNADASRLPGPWLLVEGGGSRTWVAAVGSTTVQLSGPSTNVFTASGSRGRTILRKLLGTVLVKGGISGGDVDTVFVAHGAAGTDRTAEMFADYLAQILLTLSVRTRLIVTSDMVPVLMSEHGDAVVAAIAGTGTIYAAHRGLLRWARSSGADYLLSDEGGGFDLAVNGLRAAIRATDGRGPATDLVDRARQWVAAPNAPRLSDALFARVYVAHPRTVVAGFARSVLDAARDGDDVALRLTDAAAAEFLLGVRAVAERVGIAQDSPRVVLSGSLATAESPLRQAILALLDRHMSPTSITSYAPEDLAAKASGVVRLICDQGERLAGLRTILPVVIRQVN